MASVLSYSAGVSADDTDLFFSSESALPNILFVLDDSDSMKNGPAGGPSRMDSLKLAMEELVTNLEGVNAGIVQFHKFVEFTAEAESIDDAAHRQSLRDTVDALVHRSNPSLWGTSTIEALWTARSYFRGELAGPAGDNYPSPATHECQQNHVILMTDGRPTTHGNYASVISDVETTLGSSCDAAAGATRGGKGGLCGMEIGQHLFDTPLIAGFPDSNVTTHTIGFDFDDPWLARLSGNTDVIADPNSPGSNIYSGGFGSHFTVSSADALLSAFNTIIDGIGTTFAAPTAPVNSFNESRHSGELYFEQFVSSESVRWNGNIKKYKLDELTDDVTGETKTVIVDANNLPLVDADGQINATSRSLWADVGEPDGGAIPLGGFAHQLPAYTERHWYTDYESTDPVKVTHSDLGTLPPESLGAIDGQERDALVLWALGRDTAAFDELAAAAATNEETAANQAAVDAAVVEAQAIADSAAKDLVEEAAVTRKDDVRTAADNAEVAYNDAVANNSANAIDLFEVWDDLENIEYLQADVEATTAAAEAAAARQAASDATSDRITANAAATIAIGAAVEANDENHHFVADSLHNSPLIASYWAKSYPDEAGEILFSANNMGVLHAVDPVTGVELWSYTPEEHLGNIKSYFDNEASQDHVYGLDGEFTLHTTRIDQVDYDFFVDTAWLYMTERRGGNRVYALDVSDGLTDDPSTKDPFSVMWKITGGDGGTTGFSDLAQTWSKPQMISVDLNCPDNCERKELLMFSGGYNADIYDNETLDYNTMTVPADGHGNAVYFVDPATGELAWSVGNGNHHSLNLADMNHSIPSTPVPVDTDLDGSIDVLFFVDVGGDVWRVDLGGEGTSLDELHVAGGKIAELSPAGQSLRFFNPVDVVVSGANYSTAFFSLVTGSGMRTSPLYEEPNQNRLYTIVDRWIRRAPYRINAAGEEEYDYRYVTDSSGIHSVITAGGGILKNVSDATSTTSDNYGFFRTFQLGEKLLQPTFVTSNLIFSNSYVPPALIGGVNCNYDIGETRLYITSLLNGESAVPASLSTAPDDFIEVGGGLLASGQIIDTGADDAPLLLIGPNAIALKEITTNEAFRKFRRTGWIELDEY